MYSRYSMGQPLPQFLEGPQVGSTMLGVLHFHNHQWPRNRSTVDWRGVLADRETQEGAVVILLQWIVDIFTVGNVSGERRVGTVRKERELEGNVLLQFIAECIRFLQQCSIVQQGVLKPQGVGCQVWYNPICTNYSTDTTTIH